MKLSNFKLKVKHVFLLFALVIPFFISLVYIISTQNGNGIAANILIGYVIMFGIFAVISFMHIAYLLVKDLIEAWNNEI